MSEVGQAFHPNNGECQTAAIKMSDSPATRNTGVTQRTFRPAWLEESAKLITNSAGHKVPMRWPDTSMNPANAKPIPYVTAAKCNGARSRDSNGKQRLIHKPNPTPSAITDSQPRSTASQSQSLSGCNA